MTEHQIMIGMLSTIVVLTFTIAGILGYNSWRDCEKTKAQIKRRKEIKDATIAHARAGNNQIFSGCASINGNDHIGSGGSDLPQCEGYPKVPTRSDKRRG